MTDLTHEMGRPKKPLFEFCLKEIDQTTQFESEGSFSSSWYSLTDGFFVINPGNDRLFEYTEHADREFGGNVSDQNDQWARTVDYFVAQLLDDIVEMVPFILSPIPSSLRPWLFVSTEKYLKWQNLARERCSWDTLMMASSWMGSGVRRLDNGYLSTPAKINLFSFDDIVQITWDNRDLAINGGPVWSACNGSFQISSKEFIVEVQNFIGALMHSMQNRIDFLSRRDTEQKVKIDLAELEREHLRREEKYDISSEAAIEDWDAIAQAIQQISEKVPLPI